MKVSRGRTLTGGDIFDCRTGTVFWIVLSHSFYSFLLNSRAVPRPQHGRVWKCRSMWEVTRFVFFCLLHQCMQMWHHISFSSASVCTLAFTIFFIFLSMPPLLSRSLKSSAFPEGSTTSFVFEGISTSLFHLPSPCPPQLHSAVLRPVCL